jgi:hypothetical protein
MRPSGPATLIRSLPDVAYPAPSANVQLIPLRCRDVGIRLWYQANSGHMPSKELTLPVAQARGCSGNT